jgi:hypothetical protein
MVDYYCGNGPACGQERRANLRQALSNEQDRKKRGSTKAEQPSRYLDFARRFHRVRDRFGRARENAPTSAEKANSLGLF